MQTLNPGDAGELALFVQRRLVELGFGPLPLSGTLDAPTLRALDALQDERQIPEKDLVGDLTWLALLDLGGGSGGALSFGGSGSDPGEELVPPTVAPGGTGADLGEAQLRLRALGYDTGREALLGPRTEEALVAFQASRSLERTGALDAETLLALRLATAQSGPLFLYADDQDLRPSKQPVAFGQESRDVEGDGGYRYRQFEDGAVAILEGPSARVVGLTLRAGPAWEAISAEIGPFPLAETELKRGDKGEAVRALQRRLVELGFGPLEADGDFGAGSERALRRLQAACGLPQTGRLDAATRGRVDDPWPTLSLGYEGQDLRALQERLRAMGAPITTCNGCYTDETINAVRWLQQREGLPVTGELDARSRGRVLGAEAIELPEGLAEAEQRRLRGLLERGLATLPAEARPAVQAVLGEAISWVGRREIPKGSNGGPQIDPITADAAPPGKPRPPWCALAVMHWMKAGLGCARWQDTPIGWRNASSLAFGKWGEDHGRLLPASGPAPVGSIFVMYREGSGSDAGRRVAGAGRWEGLGHTGLVVADLGDAVLTVDGNISDRCWSMTRKKSGLLGFVRWW